MPSEPNGDIRLTRAQSAEKVCIVIDMPEKPTRKLVSITVKRTRPYLPKVMVTTGFRFRVEKTGLLDLHFDVAGTQSTRVLLDPVIVASNLHALNKYAAGLSMDPDDAAQREEIPAALESNCANIVHFSHMGQRAETIFGLFSLADWAEAARRGPGADPAEIESTDVLVVYSTTALQKKLLLELSAKLSQLSQTAKQ